MSKMKSVLEYRAKPFVDVCDEQLHQLTSLTWDGDLISKSETTVLLQEGKAMKIQGGWNIITKSGLEYLHLTDKIRP